MSTFGRTEKGFVSYDARKPNQDSYIISKDLASGALLLAVFDGHGEDGHLIANFFTERLEKAVFGHKNWLKISINAVLCDTLQVLETACIAYTSIDTEFSGTTAAVVVLYEKVLHAVTLGDTRVLVGKKKSESVSKDEKDARKSARDPKISFHPVQLSQEHRPADEEEQSRILNAGGRVFPVKFDDGIVGPMRLWLGEMDVPGLTMSRSLCDTVAHTAGLISTPDVHEHNLSGKVDECIVLSTDGLWTHVSNEEVVTTMSTCIDPNDGIETLFRESKRRWMREEQFVDDMTIIYVRLQTNL
eukprot:g4508.t1